MENIQNGHELPTERRQLGRRAPMPPLFTFPHSGVTVGLYRTSQETLGAINRAVRKAIPEPPIPMRTVKVGETEEEVQEPAHDDPEYGKALYQHAVQVAQEIGRRMVRLAIKQMIVTMDDDAQAALEKFKAEMAAIDVELDPDMDDRELYIRHLVITSDKDLNALMDYLMYQSAPTEAGVQESKAEFPGQVQG